MVYSREVPEDWEYWAYHVTGRGSLESIARTGLRAEPHAHADDEPVLFVEPDLENVLIYHDPGKTAVLRFRTPGFADLPNGESVLFGKSEYEDGYPDAPFVGEKGEIGVIPSERLQILDEDKRLWRWLVSAERLSGGKKR